ncbi:hypothetical protein GCM10020216_079780 [Nonomuraea helvata]
MRSEWHRLGQSEQAEAHRPQRQPSEDHRLVSHPVGEAAARQEHALLAEVAYAEDEASLS